MTREDLEFMWEELAMQVRSSCPWIVRQMESVLRRGMEYRVLECSEALTVTMRRAEGGRDEEHLGFPFPIASRPGRFRPARGYSSHFYLRGKAIRDHQRDRSISRLAGRWPLVRVCRDWGKEEFREVCRSALVGHDGLDLVELSDYIGDSIIGKEYGERVSAYVERPLEGIFSRHWQHLPAGWSAGGLEGVEALRNRAVLLVNVLDNQARLADSILQGLWERNCVVLVIGRNLMLQPRAPGGWIHAARLPDHLLRNQNIEDYMRVLLDPIVPLEFELPGAASPGFLASARGRREGWILVNPFASSPDKMLRPELVIPLVVGLRERFPKTKLILCEGLKAIPWQGQNVALLRHALGSQPGLEFRRFTALREIGNLEWLGAITADTSIAHFCNAVGIPNLTVYNSGRWDPASAQSMASDSPLGFCRFGSCQLPAIGNDKPESETAGLILDAADWLWSGGPKILPKMEPDFRHRVWNFDTSGWPREHAALLEEWGRIIRNGPTWLGELFHPGRLLEAADRNNDVFAPLVAAAWKLTPLTKITCNC